MGEHRWGNVGDGMWGSAIAAYVHYLSFMLIVGALTVERLTLKPDLTLGDAWKVAIADGVYGISATLVLITGVLRVLYFGQGTPYYLHNPVFYAKVALFFGIGLLSLYPTVSFLPWIAGLRQGKVPSLPPHRVNQLNRIITIELVGFLLIPLLAAMLARGIGADWPAHQ